MGLLDNFSEDGRDENEAYRPRAPGSNPRQAPTVLLERVSSQIDLRAQLILPTPTTADREDLEIVCLPIVRPNRLDPTTG